VIELPYSAIIAPANRFLGRLSLLALSLLAFGFAGAWWLSRRITQPLRAVTTAAEAIGAADYSRRVKVVGEDEIGRLASAFNTMAGRVREAQRGLEERFRLLVDRVVDYAIFMLDRKGRVITWNAGAARLKGYAPEEILGHDFSCFYSPDDIAAGKPVRELEIAAAEGRVEDEGWRVRKDGSRFWASVVITALRDATGDLTGFVKVARDLTERKQAEEAVRERERRLVALLEALPVAVFVLDGAGMPHYANAASRAILGQGIVPGATPDRLPEVYQAYVAGTNQIYPVERLPVVRSLKGERVYVADMEIRRPDGTVPVEVWSAPIFDATERHVISAVAVFSDISERKRTEQKIQDLNAELALRVTELTEVNHELDAFAYSVAHDLRTPLRSIDGFSQVLLEDYAERLDDSGRESLHRVRAASQHMASLIDDLLKLSRVTRAEIQREDVDLSSLAEAIAGELKRGDPRRDVQFRIAGGLVASGDRRLLRVTIENLLANAWKYTGKHARACIEFGATQMNGQPTYYVRDDGAGFEMAYADKLFGVFQRLHTLEEFEGSGVGLATVRRIIGRHGGRVWAEGAVEQGATFYFTL
jgi:PAS domain S-box-containing protein